MAESTESFCHGLAQYLEIRLGIPTQCVAGIPWQERERLLVPLGPITSPGPISGSTSCARTSLVSVTANGFSKRSTRFVAAHDTDYDPIRRMADVAASISLI